MVKIRSYWYRVSLSPNKTDVLIKEENVDTDIYTGRTPCEAAEIRAVQEKPRNTKDHQQSQKLEEEPGIGAPSKP